MVKHAMHYVQRGQKVLDEVSDEKVRTQLALANDELVHAESRLVAAYGAWRLALKAAAKKGSALAQQYHEESTWDLT